MTPPRSLLVGGIALLAVLLAFLTVGASGAVLLGLFLLWLAFGWKATAHPGAIVDASGLGGDPVRRTLWCTRCESGFVASGASDGRCTTCRRVS